MLLKNVPSFKTALPQIFLIYALLFKSQSMHAMNDGLFDLLMVPQSSEQH
jgi:hypothetical protein